MSRVRAGWLSAGAALAAALLIAAAQASPGEADATLRRGSPAARLSRAAGASEYWDLTAAFDSGHQLFARFSITNEGPGSETAYAIGHVLLPDGSAVPFENGRRKGRWSISADGLQIEVGSSALDQHSPVHRLAVEKRKKGIHVDLRFRPESELGRALDPGLGSYRVDLLSAAAPVEGTLWVRGMQAPALVRGMLAATHTWMEQSEAELVLRRIEFFSLSPETRLYVSDLTTPEGARSGWLVLERSSKPLLRTAGCELSLEEEEGRSAAPAGYPLPGRLQLHCPDLDGEIRLGRVLLSHDPMGLIPQPFRLILSFRMRPRRVWIEAAFEVRLRPGSDDSRNRMTGSGIVSVTFLNPVPPVPGSNSAASGKGSGA